MKNLMKVLGYVLYSVLLSILLLLYPMAYRWSSTDVTIIVKDKERITTGSGQDISSKFVIYANDEVFENTDSFLFMKFNSADFQNELEIGKIYRVKVAGWRIPFLSWYRNIVSIN